MDWKRFKKIVIVVLVVINIFFLIYYIQIKRSDMRINDETRKDVITVLEKGNIILEADMFPENIEEYSACYVSRLISSESPFAKKLTGKNGTISENDELFVIKPNEKQKIGLNEADILSACEKYMKEHRINAEMYRKDYVSISGKKAVARFNLVYDNREFFDSFIEFDISEKGIDEIRGRNIIKEDNISVYKEKLMPLEGILVAIRGDKITDKPLKITEIKFGYYLGKSAGVYESVLSLPVWKVSFEDKSYLYYDARNGNIIYM
ncbi:MAG: hypothetical protein E7415_01880 [Ruminococcaceae bacterium]|nr:hypothetical protein [Oscillospiraceae bacterium]